MSTSRVTPIPFRSTPPREGRPERGHVPACFMEFRSTPPREGRLGTDQLSDTLELFRSTPPREGRPQQARQRPWLRSFRSTPPREGRPLDLVDHHQCLIVSIHAPTRGATRRRRCSAPSRKCFDPRPHARGDLPVIGNPSAVKRFRSTPPREGRREIVAGRITSQVFRSTPPREGRQAWTANCDGE